jgi:hypothetical protein
LFTLFSTLDSWKHRDIIPYEKINKKGCWSWIGFKNSDSMSNIYNPPKISIHGFTWLQEGTTEGVD